MRKSSSILREIDAVLYEESMARNQRVIDQLCESAAQAFNGHGLEWAAGEIYCPECMGICKECAVKVGRISMALEKGRVDMRRIARVCNEVSMRCSWRLPRTDVRGFGRITAEGAVQILNTHKFPDLYGEWLYRHPDDEPEPSLSVEEAKALGG